MNDETITKEELMDTLVRLCKNMFPHGHYAFVGMAIKEMELHSKKNHDYTRGGDALGNFNRVAQILSLYPGLYLCDPYTVALVYMLKQLDAALWMISRGYEGSVEGVGDRLNDVSVYAKLIQILLNN